MQNSEKTNERSLRYLKTDQRTDHGPRTDMGDYIGPSRVNPGFKIDIQYDAIEKSLFWAH